jgi:hypothetical protein
MRSTLILSTVMILAVSFLAFLGMNADRVAMSNKQACVDRGGFPISKGPRTYDYYCFKNNPLLEERTDQ